MRQVREVLRLKLVGGVPIREIARRIGVAASTVRATIRRFQAAGLSWPLPEEMTDAVLEAKLFADAGTKQGHRRQVEPDWASIHRELKRKHVTLSILWDEYVERNPEGYRYSRFCELYRSWEDLGDAYGSGKGPGRRLWHERLSLYRRELGIDHEPPPARLDIAPFGDAMCTVVEDAKPEVVSFHFGLPSLALLARVKAAGCRVMSSATTVEEACWLEARGVDVIIAQGYEAGGHRGMFLAADLNGAAASQSSTLALVPQIVDAVSVPVVAAGGIADGRGIAATFALGAAGAQIGTAYLLCPEAATPPLHRDALHHARGDATFVTNVFTGRPARVLVNRLVLEVGPISDAPPDFPLPMGELVPLRTKAEQQGNNDFTPLWSGQAAPLAREMPAKALTLNLAKEAAERFKQLDGRSKFARLPSRSPSLGPIRDAEPSAQ
jgi:nitronate monooxygenase